MSAPFAPAATQVLTRDAIITAVREIAAKQFWGTVTLDSITADSSFTDDLGGDSLDAVEVAMSLEERFNIEIRDETMDGIVTVADAAQAVIEALAASGRPVAEGVA